MLFRSVLVFKVRDLECGYNEEEQEVDGNERERRETREMRSPGLCRTAAGKISQALGAQVVREHRRAGAASSLFLNM